MIRFYGEDLLVPRPTSKLQDYRLLAACYWLFNTFAATLHIEARSPIRNLRTPHSVLAGTHLSWGATIRLIISVHRSVCLSAWNKSVSTERSFIKLILVYFSRICRESLRFIKSGQEYQVLDMNTRYLTWIPGTWHEYQVLNMNTSIHFW
jgi:hypothetical protein